MAFQYRFERILKVNESEKKQLEQIYQELFRLLEAQGQKLIDLMKKKETLVNQLEGQKKKKISVMGVRDHLQTLEYIGSQIIAEQEKYETIRERLEKFKAVLMDKSIEVKKYEKLRELHFDHYLSEMKRNEERQMDETALHQVYKQ